MLCKPNGTLQFFVNRQPLPHPPHKVPKTVYAVVDLYGRCSGVRLQPLATVNTSRTSMSLGNGRLWVRSKSKTQREDSDSQGSSAKVAGPSKPGVCGGDDVEPYSSSCPYQRLCERFRRSLALPGNRVSPHGCLREVHREWMLTQTCMLLGALTSHKCL